ncbi:N-acetylmuramidase family protein [Spirosoma sordidisoli]|uniref:N-acetylmuramidase family protein n=1 Tax=Spirosoma sordidisoli TaxID=2502893 RepID=A0A4Q2UQ45_9BACT|nr:N-acetylmuramidase family protein [Spirosoma sordidisoli]RYC69750.1 N-acetylmuramidase family protein [Spirosoma sordidisoli]
MEITLADYQAAAALLRTGVAEIRAVADVESRGRAFLPDGRLVIRFEGHRFRKHTKGKYDKSHPTLSHKYMPNCPYNKGVASDYKRLKIAMALDPTAALMSCSWGMFQIMGDEYWRCGFKDVHAFVDALKTGEKAHLLAVCQFILSKNLDDALRTHNWRAFAFGYNGADYEVNEYHLELARRYSFYLLNS